MARSKNEPHPIDVQVGKRLRQGRVFRGLSQQQLGKQIDHPITFQQVQKYERGQNRISISRLHEFATALRLPLSFFLPADECDPIPVFSPQDMRLLEVFHLLAPGMQDALLALMQKMEQH